MINRLFSLKNLQRPFVIAEMSGNHNQSLDRALEIVDAAAATGAHALKLQTYTADTMTLPDVLTIEDKNSLWAGMDLHKLYQQAYTPWEWHQAIFERAKQHGMIAFSSPFDETSVDFLETLNVPLYKIASFENTHHPLLKKVAQTGKPIIMSTGVANLNEIIESVQVLKDNGCKDITLLKCTSTYPATPENTNLLTIPLLKQVFPDCTIGLSDHTMGIGVSVASVALGAMVLEKHFTLRRVDGGVDSAFSMEPEEMKNLVVESDRAYLALGKVQTEVQKIEEKSIIFKRSIYFVRDMQAGDVITEFDLKIIRPGFGLVSKYFNTLIGRTLAKDVKRGTPTSWDVI